MASKYKEDEYVQCPYYRKESPTELKCVGMCGKHTAHMFINAEEKNLFKENFCKGFYWNCPCYIALQEDGK